MTEAFLTVTCPGCGATSRRVPAKLAGREIRCGSCQVRFTAPAPPPASPPQARVGDEPAPTVPELAAAPPTVADAGAAAPTRADGAADAATRAEAGADAPTALEGAARPAPAPPGAPGTDWKPGEVVLGLYEVIGVLGQGGMGRVYRVRHQGWGLDLAAKVPLPEVLKAAGGADAFEREAETWVSLGLHPHVATCHYVRRVGDVPLVFAELVDGGSLLDAMRQRRLTTLESILDVAVQTAWGLHHAHEQGLVHRDVKPANVLLTAEGDAKVTDFGLARGRGGRGPRVHGAGAQTMTVEGGGGGTPAYLSPEQAAGGAMTRRADVWSFALTVLEMFVGRRTWEYGLAAPEVLGEYRRGGLALPGLPPMPDPVADLLAQCFQEEPTTRPRDLTSVAAVLRTAWEAATSRAYPRREPRGGRESADGWNNRAVSLVDLGRTAEARALWRRALETQPQHVEATYNSGLVAWVAGHLDDEELLRRTEESCTSHASAARAHQLLGRVRILLGDATGARTSLARAGELGGTDDLSRDLDSLGEPIGGAARPFVLRGLPGPVTAVCLSPDGHTVIAAGGGEARVWDATSGTLLKTLGPTEGAVRALLPLPDGRFLVVASEKSPLRVWDLVSGQAVRTWPRHPGFSTCLALVPGGRLVVSGSSDRVVRLWEATSDRCVLEMSGHEDAVTTVAAGRTHVVSGARDGSVRVWAMADGRCLAILRGHEGRVGAVALAEGDSRVVSAGDDRTVRDFGLHSHELVRTYTSHAGAVHALALTADGRRMLSGATDRTIRTWDLDGERLVAWSRLDSAVDALAVAADGTVWAGHGSAVSALRPPPLRDMPRALCRPSSAIEVETRAESFDERVAEARLTLAAGELARAVSLVRTARAIPGHERSESALQLWDELCARLPRRGLRSAWEEGRLTGHPEPPLAVALGRDGGRAFTGGLDGSVRVFDTGSRETLVTLTGHEGAVNSVAALGAGGVVSAGRDRTVRIWDLEAGRLRRTLEGHDENVTSVDASPDGRLVVSGSWDGTARLWDPSLGAVLHVLEGHEAHVAAVSCAPDAEAVATAGWDGTVRIWEAESGEPVAVLAGHEGNVTALALHPSARSVASGGEDGTVRLWDPRTGRATRTLQGHHGEITGVCFTPDGHYLVSSGRDHTVRLWDLRRGTEVRSLPHPAAVHAVALAPLGNFLLAAAGDRDVHVWHLDWEPENEAATGWDETARPFLETQVRLRRSRAPTSAPSIALSDPEIDAVVADLRRRGYGAFTRETVRPRLEALSSRPAESGYWESLKRSAPKAARPAPARAATAVRRVPWKRLGLAALAILAVGVGVASWRTPEATVALSPYMQRAVRAEIDLIDVSPFARDCDPGSYETRLELLRAGTPAASDVACLAAHGDAQTVSEVLDTAPLTDDVEPIRATRLLRNAASVLATLPPDALDALCARLGDPRDEVARATGMALAEAEGETAAACVRDTLRSGSPRAKAAAILPFRQLLARGALGATEGWELVQALADDSSPDARAAGLRAASMFRFSFAEPLARSLLDDPEPAVADAARAALQSIDTVHRTDLLAGHGDP